MNLSKNLQFVLWTFTILIIANKSIGQTLNNVGIGTVTPNPSSILELSANDKGFLAPRMTTADRVAIPSPARGLWVYDIDFDHFWYFNGVIWIMADNCLNAWSLTGNSNTSPMSNFLGTLDANDFVIKTNGSAFNKERIRITSSGQVIINNQVPKVGELFSVYASGTTGALNAIGDYAISGYTGANGVGVFGENLGTGIGIFGKSATSGAGVYGTNNSNGDGVWGDGASGTGVRGQSLNNGIGVFGSNDASGYGVYGYNSGSGIGLVGINSNMTASAGYAIYGQSSFNTTFGVYAVNSDFNGTAVIGVGNNNLPSYLTTGSGGAFTGLNSGLFSIGTLNSDGNGILSVANNLATYGSIAGGAGIAANAYNIGVYGIARSFGTAVDSRAGGYFVNGIGGGAAYSYVGIFDGVANRKIVGNGTVNTIVKNLNDKPVLMSAPESPENLFSDYGSGKLINGKVHVKIDPVFSKNIMVSSEHPLRVFVQLEGDCKGVYVTSKSSEGFDVIELDGGNSNTEFTWTVVANRANETREDGFILKYSDERFSTAPLPLEEKIITGKTVEKPIINNSIQIKKKSILKK
jgi:hypothetical protein